MNVANLKMRRSGNLIADKIQLFNLRNDLFQHLLYSRQSPLSGRFTCPRDALHKALTEWVILQFAPTDKITKFEELWNDMQIVRSSEELSQFSKLGIGLYLLKGGLRKTLAVRSVLLIGPLDQNLFVTFTVIFGNNLFYN